MSSLPPNNSARPDSLSSGTEMIWGLGNIARALGLSVGTTRRPATRPGVPIYWPDGRPFALRSELNAWLRSKTG